MPLLRGFPTLARVGTGLRSGLVTPPPPPLVVVPGTLRVPPRLPRSSPVGTFPTPSREILPRGTTRYWDSRGWVGAAVSPNSWRPLASVRAKDPPRGVRKRTRWGRSRRSGMTRRRTGRRRLWGVFPPSLPFCRPRGSRGLVPPLRFPWACSSRWTTPTPTLPGRGPRARLWTALRWGRGFPCVSPPAPRALSFVLPRRRLKCTSPMAKPSSGSRLWKLLGTPGRPLSH